MSLILSQLLIISCSLLITFTTGLRVNHSSPIASRACPCYNQGLCDSSTGSCVCPSGYVGQQCERLESTTLCNNVVCKNSGVCNIISPTVSTCWCLLGFHGAYCERQSAGSRCAGTQCRNGGICYEHSPASSVFSYCACPPGFTGRFCETQYFRCSQSGLFVDQYQCAQGSYFLCDSNNNLIQGTCAKGLRFNINKMSCDRASSVICANV
ncbi:unnamed protein product [Rotaria socialis]|uniref:Uncharacterized protein n=1 Tax=Rotaria socialis TaxID=392032 RepID=A0A817RCC8_9BILA|nr:unnamed protein product [Rotaria socialis]CAF3249195.1 unnamed protein product [Rotaria socialis]CAF3415743.1 unnamed protein product [Rotaria socialis]CAF3462364.1 unnamed protein product [Rotaria socialis]CAF3707683.1 unnamed protein product [Rotaria socialis]